MRQLLMKSWWRWALRWVVGRITASVIVIRISLKWDTTLITLPRSDLGNGARGICCGPEHAPRVLLLHGVGLALEAWSPQIESLSRSYRVLAVDLPGHGESELLPDGASLHDYVQWAAAVIDAWNKRDGAAPVSVAGHSMGALIALGLAVDRPDLLNRVALLNAVYQRDDSARAAVLARADQISNGDSDPTAPLNRWFDAHEHSASAYQITSTLLHNARTAGYAAAYRVFADGDSIYADQLDKVQCPLLALTADGDVNSTPAMAESIAAGVVDGQVVVIEGHRHMLNLTAAVAVNAVLHRWMERCNEDD